MGTTISNLHVFRNNRALDSLKEQTIAGLQAAMLSLGFQKADTGRAETTLTLLCETDSRWISVYSINLHLQDLAAALSQTVGTVVKLSVFDSDVLEMYLYQEGQVVDTYSDWANYDELPRERVGNAERWQVVLPSNTPYELLQTAWQSDPVDYPFTSEGILYRAIDLLQIERWRVWGVMPDNQLPESAQVIKLDFRSGQPLPYDVPATGLPIFQRWSYLGKAEVKKGQNFGITFSFMNLGGSAQGIEIILQSQAVELGLVEPIGLISEPPFDFRSGTVVANSIRQVNSNGSATYRFLLPDYAIKAGISDWKAAYELPIHLRDIRRESALQQMFTIVWQAKKLGSAQLQTVMRPLENLTAGAEFTTDIQIT